MIFKARHYLAGQGVAGPGLARLHVTQYGNWDNFLTARLGPVGRGTAWPGGAGHGKARLDACRWAVSPDIFVSNNQGNQSKTT